MTIGVFLPNWVGDVVMATPTLRALRRHFGGAAHIVGIMRPSVAPVLDGTSWLDERWFFDPASSAPARRAHSVTWKMWRRHFDIVVLLVNSLRTAQMAWLARARQRVGYVRNGRGPFLTIGLQPLTRDGRFVPMSTLDYYLELAYALGCAPESPRLELATTETDEALVDKAWSELGLDAHVVTMNASGAFGPAKLWPDEYFAELAARVARTWGHQVLFLCGPAERERAARIARLAACDGVVSLAGQTPSIGLSKACVRRSQLLVTTDSGPRHFAPAFGVRSVVLFGPTHIAWSHTHAESEMHLQIPVECGPCQLRECPYVHHKCMRDLGVDQVFRAVQSALRPTAASVS